MFFLIAAGLMATALAGSPLDNVLPVPNRVVRRVTTLTSPVDSQQTGTVSYCKHVLSCGLASIVLTSTGNKWYKIVDGDSCPSVEAAFGITHAQFLQWNPAVSQDCSQNFWLNYDYCVGISASSTPGAPTMTGIPCACNMYYTVVDGDSCPSVEAKFGISHAQFLQWNPSISQDCSQNFWLNEAYCVGVNTAVTACPTSTSVSVTSSTAPVTSSSSETTSSTTTIPPNTERYSTITGDISASLGPRPSATEWPPSPTGAGTIVNCRKYCARDKLHLFAKRPIRHPVLPSKPRRLVPGNCKPLLQPSHLG